MNSLRAVFVFFRTRRSWQVAVDLRQQEAFDRHCVFHLFDNAGSYEQVKVFRKQSRVRNVSWRLSFDVFRHSFVHVVDELLFSDALVKFRVSDARDRVESVDFAFRPVNQVEIFQEMQIIFHPLFQLALRRVDFRLRKDVRASNSRTFIVDFFLGVSELKREI